MPPRSATTRRARHAGTGSALALERLSPAALEGDGRVGRPLGRLVHEDGARLARRLEAEAVFTRSPATMPWPLAAERDRRLAGHHRRRAPARLGRPRARRDGVHHVERCAHRALRVVLVRDRRAPHRHDRIADELLDRAAVPPDDLVRELEVPGQGLADLLGVRVSATR